MEISSDFEEDYQDRLSDVLRSDHRSFAVRLRDWLSLLDNSPESSAVVLELEQGIDFEAWFEQAQTTQGSMVGSGRLNWDADRTKRLGQTLGLVRHLSSQEDAALQFAMGFMYAGNNLNDNVHKVVEQIVEPFGRDLWKHIVRKSRQATAPTPVPAADRLVTLDHNSADYQELISRINQVAREARNLNSLAIEPEFERIEAEIGAGRRLLEAARARVEAVRVVLVPALKWVAAKAGEHAIGLAVTALLVLIASIFGITIPGV